MGPTFFVCFFFHFFLCVCVFLFVFTVFLFVFQCLVLFCFCFRFVCCFLFLEGAFDSAIYVVFGLTVLLHFVHPKGTIGERKREPKTCNQIHHSLESPHLLGGDFDEQQNPLYLELLKKALHLTDLTESPGSFSHST